MKACNSNLYNSLNLSNQRNLVSFKSSLNEMRQLVPKITDAEDKQILGNFVSALTTLQTEMRKEKNLPDTLTIKIGNQEVIPEKSLKDRLFGGIKIDSVIIPNKILKLKVPNPIFGAPFDDILNMPKSFASLIAKRLEENPSIESTGLCTSTLKEVLTGIQSQKGKGGILRDILERNNASNPGEITIDLHK